MNIAEILSQVKNTPESIAAARRAVLAQGMNAEQADFEILIALGGSDTVEADAAGTEFYVRGDGSRLPVNSINWPKTGR
ncbi:MAG: hypothetical protein KJ579_07030 [Verrucomicrobia bacterium]|nr:hypothetical protein [Verrucomicrobiota bacterium]